MNQISLKIIIATVAALWITLLSSSAWADEPPPTFPMPISDEAPTEEAVFPDPVALEKRTFKRGEGGVDKAGRPRWGIISLGVDGYKREYAGLDEPYDPNISYDPDSVENAQYGLSFKLEGEYPDSINISPDPRVPLHYPGEFSYSWRDADTNDERIDATITATWVDRYGRQGPTSDPVHISDDTNSGGSCTTASNGSSSPAILLALLLLLLALQIRSEEHQTNS